MWTLTLGAHCATGHGAVCEDGGGSGGAGGHPGGGHVLPVSEWQRYHAGLCHCSGRAACQERSHTAYQVSTTTSAIVIHTHLYTRASKKLYICTGIPYSIWQKQVHVVVPCWTCQALLLCQGLVLRKAEISCRQMQTFAGRLCTPHTQSHKSLQGCTEQTAVERSDQTCPACI